MMPTPDAAKKPKRKFAVIILVVLAMAAIIWALFIVVHPNEVRTNDAQVDGHIHPLNARVSGTILWVNPAVQDTRFVKAGTVLARLDPNDYQPTVDRLEGDVQASDAQLRTAILGVPI